jgi:hypothetical protein
MKNILFYTIVQISRKYIHFVVIIIINLLLVFGNSSTNVINLEVEYEAIFDVSINNNILSLLLVNASSNNSLLIEKDFNKIIINEINNFIISYNYTYISILSMYIEDNGENLTNFVYVTNTTTKVVPETCARLSYYYSVTAKNCKNCTRCSEDESLIDSCTATTDTTCTVLCPPGSVSLAVIADTPNQCTLCAMEKFASMGNKSCQYCKDGYFSNTVGQSTCLRCPEGMSTSMYSGFDICQKVYTLHHIFKLLCLGL